MNGESPDEKLAKLRCLIASTGSALVAFSGGVDSSFLLKVCADVLAPIGGRLFAVTARSSTYPASELEEAISFAKSIGVKHTIIDSEELEIDRFAGNPPDRCYYCKNELFGKLVDIAKKEGISAVFDGANADDLTDHRPGSKAAIEHGVQSPLQIIGFTKNDIRLLSKQMDLLTWDKPAFACLASRFPYGAVITHKKLAMVERAEEVIRKLGFRQLRVRHHGDVARIELERSEIAKAIEPVTANKIKHELGKIGFVFVSIDIEGYRTGSMNEVLHTDNR